MADLRVYGRDALAEELRRLHARTSVPLVLVTEPQDLPLAVADEPSDAVVAVTAFSAGGEVLRRRFSITRPVATFGATVPLAEIARSEVALPPRLSSGEAELWRGTLGDVFGEVEVVEESPGLVTARILAGLVNEAAYLLGETGGDPDGVDEAMRLGVNYPVGPLLWGDMIGLDVIHRLLVALCDAYGRERHRPAPLLVRKVMEGKTGVLGGEGFYRHPRR